MKKVIYIYTDQHSPNQYKIGKADQRENQSDDVSVKEIAEVRVAEQFTAATRGDARLVAYFDISNVESSRSVENAVHAGIEQRGFDRLVRKFEGKEGSTEWFEFPEVTEGEVISLVKSLVEEETGFATGQEFRPRVYQAYVKGLLLDQLSQGKKVIGAELAARFGKTLWTLDAFNTMSEEFDFQYLILPAYVLTAHSSFQKELRKFKNFDDMVFISDKDSDFEEKVRANAHKRLVIATSLHTPEDSLFKLECIAELPKEKKVAFIDEADFGAHTESSKTRIDLLDVGVKVLMTGTAIERAVAGQNVDAILKWSYMDMLLLKDNNHPILNKLT